MDNRWSLENGNECFRFKEREVFERPWIIITIEVLLAACTGMEYLIRGSSYLLIPNFILFFFCALWWTTIPMKHNEAVIEKTVHDIMDGVVEKDAATKSSEVVKSKVYYDTKGIYAIITGRWFLVLLKNGSVWEYPIDYHKPTDSEDGYYECVRNYVVSENQEHIQAIAPRRWCVLTLKLKLSSLLSGEILP
ncbi:MAG: hypothetical protein MR294_10675 [Bacteroidales bacterium]|nr:hypothetical protein [Bacteroidales bacterium]